MDVRRAYLAWCAPSPWSLALVMASTMAWLLASQEPMPPLLAGFGAAALAWFAATAPATPPARGQPSRCC